MRSARSDSDCGASLIEFAVAAAVFFLAVFIESLNTSFLPQLLHQLSADAGLSPTVASLVFSLYFLCFALVLVPADSAEARMRRGGLAALVRLVVVMVFGAALVFSGLVPRQPD